jgi:serine/threonine protein kinase/tetratricopeptide (TPR) repeat protein
VNLRNTPTSKDSDAAADLEPGQDVLGQRYRLEHLLGRGSTGPVWLATDRELGAKRALKFLSQQRGLAPDELESLKAETLRCQSLTHQSIVRIYDFVRNERHAAISMEAIDGPDLRAALRKRVPPCFHSDEIRFWVEELCRAIHYAHTFAQIIHRDLKPSNLLVNRQGHLKVADFGIAQAIPKHRVYQEDASFQIAGTLEHISPQHIDSKAPSVSDDIYGFGATLFELLTGRPPFVGEDIYEQVLYQPPPFLTETRHLLDDEIPPVPQDWETLVQSCLAKEPEDRPISMLQIAEMLDLELGNVTMRDPIIPANFRVDGSAPDYAGSIRATFDELPARLTEDRRVRTLRDLPIAPDRRSLKPWSWAAGIVALGLIVNLGFCRTRSEPEPIIQTEPHEPTPVAPPALTPPPVEAVVPPELKKTLVDLRAVETAIRAGDWDQAQTQILTLIDQGHGSAPAVLCTKAKIQSRLREWGQALATLRALLRIEPNHAEATAMKARVHAALEEWYAVRHAVDWAQMQRENASDMVDLFLLRGQTSRKLGQLSDAAGDFSKEIQGNSNSAEAHYRRGLAYREEGSVPQALGDLTTATQLDPQQLCARNARARLLLESGKVAESADAIIEDLHFIIDTSPKNLDARLDRMRCLYGLHQWQGVIEDSESLLVNDPNWEEMTRLRVVATMKSGDGTASLDDLELYVKLFPKDVDHWAQLAEAYLAAGRYSDAKEAFTQVIRLNPKRYEAYEGRAFAFYSVAKELAKAAQHEKVRHTMRFLGLQDLDRFIAYLPGEATSDTYLLKTQLHFYRGDYYSAKGQASSADQAAREGMRLFPEARSEFQWWIEEIEVADGIQKGKQLKRTRGRGKPDRPNWFERFFRRQKK